MVDSLKDFERKKTIVQEMNIMDDDLFHKIVEDCSAMEEILSVLAGQGKLHLLWSKPHIVAPVLCDWMHCVKEKMESCIVLRWKSPIRMTAKGG